MTNPPIARSGDQLRLLFMVSSKLSFSISELHCRRVAVLFGWFALAVLWCLGTSGAYGQEADSQPLVKVTDVRIGEHPDKTRVVLDLVGGNEAQLFSLSDPARLVVDIPNGDWQVPFLSGERAGGAISSVRYGRLNRQVARLVLDLNYPVTLSSSEVLGGKDNPGTRVVLDLVRVSASDFRASVKLPKTKIASSVRATARTAENNSSAEKKAPVVLPPREKQPVVAPPQEKQQAKVDPPLEKPVRAPVVLDEDPEPKAKGSGKFVIVIDPGHGGRDPGAIGSKGTKEADVVLGAAKALKSYLDKKKRYETVLTRTGNTSLKLRDRIAIARKQKADLFISMHADSLPDAARVRGASAYTLSKKASDAEAAALARKENQADVILGLDLGDHTAEVNDILIDLALSHTKNSSVRFAGMLISELSNVTPVHKNPQKSAGFVVLKSPDVPSVLLELGYLSNGADEKNLVSSQWRQNTAKAIGTAIDQFFGYAEVSQIGG